MVLNLFYCWDSLVNLRKGYNTAYGYKIKTK